MSSDICESCKRTVCEKTSCPAYICTTDTSYLSFDKLNYFEMNNSNTKSNDKNTQDSKNECKNTVISHDILLVKKMNNNASLPKKQYIEDAGYDLSACIDTDVTINPGERVLIGTGLALSIPIGYYGRIAPRSGLALKNGIDVLAGVIDSTFRNEVKVLLYNTSQTPFIVKHGDRIAQIIIEIAKHLNIREVTELPSTQRNLNGFGSTGV
jgi:dUTP pyrophosphatase